MASLAMQGVASRFRYYIPACFPLYHADERHRMPATLLGDWGVLDLA